ncbi:MAG TPA: GDSL-type esterase/lipase family protein [SAR86 cluster bacterium]|nr:GDSL-type esterase/lipase family protein [SAR86 cluster bacterium]|tara:strand:- start:353 stop:1123 length:771 start_codon:yes stop_codon:yes gene_type:complete
MIKVTTSLLLIFIVAIGCSSSVSVFEDKIKTRVAENNGEMSSLEIKAAAIYLDSWSKKDFYQAAIDKFKEEDKGILPVKDLILFTGSSSIRFWSTLKEDMAPHNVLNRGFGGAHISHVNYHFNEIVKPYKPKAIVFFCGTNDLSAFKTPEETFEDFSKFFSMVKNDLPGTNLIVIGVKPSTAREYLVPEEQEFNSLISNLAGKEDLLSYISVWNPMLTDEGKANPDLFVEDGLHMNEKGYEIWAKLVKPELDILNL